MMDWLGLGLGVLGSVLGANSQNHASKQAADAAAQATAGQNQINQQTMQLYQQMAQEYQNQYAPLVPGLSSAYQDQLGSAQGMFPGIASGYSSLTGPASFAAAPSFMSYENFLGNPGGTLSSQYGQQALGDYASQANFGLGPSVNNLASFYGGTMGQGLGPAANDVAGFYSGAMQGGLGPSADQAMRFYYNEAVNGMSPETWNAALNAVDVGTERGVKSAERYAGAPNAVGLAGDVFSSGLEAKANAAAQMAGQNEQYKLAGIQGLLGTAEQQLGARQAGAQGYLGTAGQQLGARQMGAQGLLGTAESNLQAKDLGLANMLGTAGGIDQQTLAFLQAAYQNPQQALGNLAGFTNQNLTGAENFVGQGRNYLPGVASGMQGIAGQYGSAAQQAANTASSINANATNPFSYVGGYLAQNGLPWQRPASTTAPSTGGGGGSYWGN